MFYIYKNLRTYKNDITKIQILRIFMYVNMHEAIMLISFLTCQYLYMIL